MAFFLEYALILSLISATSSTVLSPSRFEVTAILPHWDGPSGELSRCTAFKMPEDTTYMVGKENKGRFRTLHHLAFFACAQPNFVEPSGYETITPDMDAIVGSPFFTCGSNFSDFPLDPPCNPGKFSHISLPVQDRFGFEMGTKNRYFVLNPHFTGNTSSDDLIEMKIVFDKRVDTVVDNFMIKIMDFKLPPLSTVYINCTHRLNTSSPIKIHYIDSHTHHSAQVQEIYKVDRQGEWSLVLKTKPGPKVNFVKTVQLDNGDVLTMRCKMVNDLNATLTSSPRHEGGDTCHATLNYSNANDPHTSAPELQSLEKCLTPEEANKALSGASYPPEDAVWPENDLLTMQQEELF